MELKLKAQLREKNERLDKDHLAAVIYGKGIESKSLKLKQAEFDKLFNIAGESNLIKLELPEGPVNVLVKDLQRDVVKHTTIHVDFYQVNMKEKVHAEIPLHFIGESKAIKELGGALIKEINEIKVECLPGDLVDHIDVDISSLQTFADVIQVSNLVIPKNIEVLLDPETNIAMVVEPKAQEEEPVAPVEAAAPAGTSPAEGAATATDNK